MQLAEKFTCSSPLCKERQGRKEKGLQRGMRSILPMSRSRMRRTRALDRLLAKGRLSGPEKEQIFAALMHDTRRAPRKRVAMAGGIAAALALCTLVAVLIPRGLDPPTTSELRAKGTVTDRPQVEVGCVGPCRRGATLLFRVESTQPSLRLAAFASGSDGNRIWYFPTKDGQLPRLGARTGTAGPQVLAKGIRLGDEHLPGPYRVTILLLRRPLTRRQILPLAQAPSGAVVAVAVAPFEVLP